MTGEFLAPRASNADIGSIWWRHHGDGNCYAGERYFNIELPHDLYLEMHHSAETFCIDRIVGRI